jgi:decaprenylphospho-beta-D-ribofuranose 2-oxidase
MKKAVLQSFDRTEAVVCDLQQPADPREISALKGLTMIARGAGLSYCNAATVAGGICVDMRALNKVLDFDSENGVIRVEAGLCIGELVNQVVAAGWIFPVLPGYPMITVGGCIAFNVHGKSQYKIGLFGDWVESLRLFITGKGEVLCSRSENRALFDLTIGGMGLTGIILSATLRLKKIDGDRMEVKMIKIRDLEDAVSVMTTHALDYDYVYSWNNFNIRGRSFGKGIVFLEKVKPGFKQRKRAVRFYNRLVPRMKIPCVLNDNTIPWMCRVYYLTNMIGSSTRNFDLIPASFPIYGKEIYYHMFGKKGFREYQVLFPHAEWAGASKEIQELSARKKIGIALASLKIFRGNPHHISFSGEGICLALDIVNDKKGISFFEDLDNIVRKYKGIINLSKDSRVGPELVRDIFPGLKTFRDELLAHDPNKQFDSSLRQRLQI